MSRSQEVDVLQLQRAGLEMAGLSFSFVMLLFLKLMEVVTVLEAAEFKLTLRCCCLEATSSGPCLGIACFEGKLRHV